MTGFYTPGDIGSVAANQLGTSILPAPTGEGIAGAFSQSATQVGANWGTLRDWLGGPSGSDETDEPTNGDALTGNAPAAKPPAMLDAATANKQYGLPGLSFSAPVSEDSAQSMYNEKHAALVRQDQIDRTSGIGATVGEFAANIVPQLADPVNIAANFVPGLPEARIAAQLGMDVASPVVRGIAGASAGIAGQAALMPVTYAMDQAQGEDFSMGQALGQIAFGGLLGGGLHILGGTLEDFIHSRAGQAAADAEPTFGSDEPVTPAQMANPLTNQIENAPSEARASALNNAVANVVDDQPINSSAVLDGFGSGNAADRAPPSLLTFLTQRGGVNDPGGDLDAMDASLQRVGFVRRNGGQTLDYAREAAEEAGYIGPGSDTNDLLEAIRTELGGQKVYPPEYQAQLRATQLAATDADHYNAAFAGAQEAVRMAADDRDIDLQPNEVDHAAHLSVGGMDPHDAIDNAVTATQNDGLVDSPEVAEQRQAGIQTLQDAARQPTTENIKQAQRDNETAVKQAPAVGGVGSDIEAELGQAQAAYDKLKERIGNSANDEHIQQLADFEKSTEDDEGYAKALEAAGLCMASRV